MKKLSLLLLLSALFFACKKDNNNGKSLSKTEIVTTGTWKITAIVSDNDGDASKETNEYAMFPSCNKDDYYTFKVGGVLERNEGPTKCDPIDPQIDNRAWQLTQNETKLVIDGDEYIIDELTTTTLRFENVEASYGTMFTMTKR
jgi:hypothetical protein